MQHKITKPSNLLDKHGELIQKGYATSPILRYKRMDVAHILRLKEWDYYLIYNNEHAIALTLGKTSHFLLASASFIDFINKTVITDSAIRIVSDKKLSMPESSENGDIIYQDKKLCLAYKLYHENRELFFSMKQFGDEADLELSFTLSDEPQDSMVIATPFKESKKDFYYNRKIIGMRASGYVRMKDQIISFDSDNSFGILDWGRGVWPYKTSWYWGAGQGMVNGSLFGFNLGYGFGDTSAATENMLFFNEVASKLKEVTIHIPLDEKNEYDYLKPWTITSSDRRFEMAFEPILDRKLNLSVVLISTKQHQVFGKFNGKAILDDGSIVCLSEFIGFFEIVENRW